MPVSGNSSPQEPRPYVYPDARILPTIDRNFRPEEIRTSEEAELILFKIMKEIEEIEVQLEDAHLFPESISTDEDRSWLIRARHAKKARTRVRMEVQSVLGRLKKAERADAHKRHQQDREAILRAKLAAAISWVSAKYGEDAKAELIGQFDDAEVRIRLNYGSPQ